MIWSEAADCVVGVAIMAQDEQYTCGEGIVDPQVAALNQSLMADAPALLESSRELHDFAEPSTHYRDGERSKQAFATAIKLLKKHGG